MTDEPKYRDEEWLREQYGEEGKTTYEIAEDCEVVAATVGDWLRKYGVDTSQRRQENNQEKIPERGWLHEQYIEQQKDQSEIAEICDCALSTVSRWLDYYNIDARPKGGWDYGQREKRVADERLLDAKWLRKQYVENQRGAPEIADECDCAHSTVQKWLSEHNIETRDSRLPEYPLLADAEWLREQYIEQSKSGNEIAEEIGCGWRTVYKNLHKHGIETRDHSGGLSGESHPHWNGGEFPYGPGWNDTKKRAVRERDDHTCQDPNCSVTQSEHVEKHGEKLHVHHLQKARDVDDPEERNATENLITLCRDCHWRWEKIADAGLVPEVVRV